MSRFYLVDMTKSGTSMSSENKRKSDLDNQCLESVQKKRKVESLNWDAQGKVECICCKERYERFKSHLNGSPKCKNEYDFEKICKEIETKRKIKNKERFDYRILRGHVYECSID